MGGNAFLIPARRLPQKQYDLLSAYVLSRLKPYARGQEIPRHLKDKTSHGDLDVLCGHDRVFPGGQEEWLPFKYEDGETPQSHLLAPHPDLNLGPLPPDHSLNELVAGLTVEPAAYSLSDHAKTISVNLNVNAGGRINLIGGGKMVVGPNLEETRELCGQMRESLAATAWKRIGSEISFKVPCTVLEDRVESGVTEDEFYQVDVMFIPLANLGFFHLMSSYSSTGVLIGRMIRHLSKSFTLHLTHLVVRHAPYFGLPPVELTLTADPSAFAAWCGLNYDVWLKHGDEWKDEREFWSWLTEVDEASLLGHALQKMARRKKVAVGVEPEGKRRKRADIADRFYDWLRDESKWALPSEKASAPPDPVISSTPTLSPVPVPSDRNLTLQTFLSSKTSKALTPPSATPTPAGEVNPACLDPAAPLPLDEQAEAALDYWHKREEYEAAVEERRIVAAAIALRQREKQERREKALRGEYPDD